MTAATLPPNPRRASRLLSPPDGDLVLRVVGSEHEGREIRIRSPKCTIGSARGCTLRLTAAGVRPLHCWILRGAGGTIIRRRDPRTRLNGRRFADAPLAPGDRLQIGSVELEVNECPRVPADWTIHCTELPEPLPSSAYDSGAADSTAQESIRQAERLRTELHELELRSSQQVEKLNGLVSQVTSERDALSQRLESAETLSTSERARLLDRVKTLEAEALGERDALLLDKQRLELSLATTEQQLAELRAHLSSRESEIESLLHAESQRVSAMQGRLEQVARERAQLESQLQEQTETLYGDVLAREAERDRLREQCQRLEVQAAQLRELVGYTAAERDNLSLRLDSREQNSYDQHRKIIAEKEELQRRLDATMAKFAGGAPPAVRQGSENAPQQEGFEQASAVQQLLEELLLEKGELETQIAERTAAWQRERESFRQQTERVKEHCKQVDGQLSHVRGLLEALVTERDAIGQQLTVADARLETERQQWQEQRAALERQIQGQTSSAADGQRQMAELAARLEAESSRAVQWQRRAEENAQKLACAGQQLNEAAERFAAMRTESDARLQAELARAQQITVEVKAARDQLATTEAALADSTTHLTVLRTESHSRLQIEQERTVQAQLQCEELTRQLASADLRLTEAERKLAVFRIAGDERVNDTLKRKGEWEQLLKTADEKLVALRQQLQTSEAKCNALQVELDAQQAAHQQSKEAAAVRWALLEQQTTSLLEQLEGRQASATQVLPKQDGQLLAELSQATEREQNAVEELARLNDECRALKDKLAKKDWELAALGAKQGGNDDVRSASSVTVSYSELKQVLPAVQPQADERAAWTADRERLEQQVAELQEQLNQAQCGQGMTLRADAIAELQSNAAGTPSDQEVADLREQLTSLEGELAKANEEREQYQAAEAAAAEQRAQIENLTREVAELRQQLAAAASAQPDEDHERLKQRIVELQEQLIQAQGSQGMTLGADAVAELQSTSSAASSDAEIARLREQYQAAEAAAAVQRAQVENLTREVAELQQQLAAAVNARPDEGREGLEQRIAELEEQLNQAQCSQGMTLGADAVAELQSTAASALSDQEVTEMRQQVTALQGQLGEASQWRERYRVAEAAAEEQRAEVENLKRELMESQQQLAAAASARSEIQAAAPVVPQPEPNARLTTSSADKPSPVATPVEQPPAGANQPPSDGPPAAVRESSSIRRSGTRPKPVWTQSDCPPPPADESIETYMARLLQRVSTDTPAGDSKEEAPPAPEATASVEPQPTSSQTASSVLAEPQLVEQNQTATSVTQAADVATPAAQSQEIAPQSQELASHSQEVTPQGQSAESPSNMEAMREVANTVARRAIVRHRREVGNRLAVAQAIGAGMTLVATGAAGWCAYRVQSYFGGFGAMIGFVAACFWFGKALGHALKAMLLEVHEADTDQSMEQPANVAADDAEPLPAARDDGLSRSNAMPAEVVGNGRSDDDAAELSASTGAKGTSADLAPTQP